MLIERFESGNQIECGCDEAGRGCLAGPVCAAAVVLAPGYQNALLNDSKQLSAKRRLELRGVIEKEALAWAVAMVDNNEIDQLNILHASIEAMNRAVELLDLKPDLLLIDGNRFYNRLNIDYRCIVGGDAKYMAIAAASILAKTHRDEYMERMAETYPVYGWAKNKGYPTSDHYKALELYGATPLHRRSFRLQRQLSLDL